MHSNFRRGFIYNDNPKLDQSDYDMIYFLALGGKERDPMFLDSWKNTPIEKRGILHRVSLLMEANEHQNAEAMEWLLDDLGHAHWNNGNPFIVDIFSVTGDERFNLDDIAAYAVHIKENFESIKKPLLRLNTETWDSFLKEDKTKAVKMLEVYDLLVVQWNVNTPVPLEGRGVPKWWEYKSGMFAHDETGLWINSPLNPIDEQSPIEQPEPSIDPNRKPMKFKVSLFGAEIGEIEEVIEESEQNQALQAELARQKGIAEEAKEARETAIANKK